MENYKLKLTIKGSEPKIWRRVEVPSNFSMASLHKLIQIVMNWDDCHMHEFIANKNHYSNDNEWGQNYKGMAICDLLIKKGSKMQYVYDFGDNWEVDIVVEKIEEVGEGTIKPTCLDGAGNPPLEDIGGIYGYMDLCQGLEDKKNGLTSELTEWIDDMGLEEEEIVAYDKMEINMQLSKTKFRSIKNPKSMNEINMEEMIGEVLRAAEAKYKKENKPTKKTSKKAMTNEEKASKLIVEAYESEPNKAIELADEAIKLNPTNYEAYFVRGNNASTVEEAVEIYRKGAEVAEIHFGKEYFNENKGFFWGLYETRPYMMMMEAYARCLHAIGDTKNSILVQKRLLELNSNDNQGIRYPLSCQLLEIKNYTEFKKLCDEYEEE